MLQTKCDSEFTRLGLRFAQRRRKANDSRTEGRTLTNNNKSQLENNILQD